MHWRFDPLFSIKIVHSKDASKKAVDFSLEPTQSTVQRMKTLNWVYRSQPGFCTVYGEKLFDTEGNTSLRVEPKAHESLAFFLRLNNSAILNSTKPYVLASKPDVIPNALPAFSGRSRLLYFDNLSPLSVSGGEFSISSGLVELTHFASVEPTLFMFDKAKNGVKKIKFTSITPQEVVTQFDLHPQTHTTEVRLPENSYRLEQIPDGPSETLVILSENVVGNTLGLIRIFKPNTGDWEPQRRYRIEFGEV